MLWPLQLRMRKEFVLVSDFLGRGVKRQFKKYGIIHIEIIHIYKGCIVNTIKVRKNFISTRPKYITYFNDKKKVQMQGRFLQD